MTAGASKFEVSVRRGNQERLYQKKSLGQVFLKAEWPVNRMVERLTELKVARVLEIGPGGGNLTRALVGKKVKVTAVEKDDRFAARLAEWAATLPMLPEGRALTVVNDDILKFDWDAWLAEGGRSAIVGNIPYNISTPILTRALGSMDRLVAVMLMTQLEFAVRVAARHGSRDFGSLSVYAQLRADVSLEFKVDRTSFHPVPKVDSAVVLALPARDRLDPTVLVQVEQVTRAAFTQRRKKLRNSVRPFLESGGGEAGCPIDLERRAESLSPREFVELTQFLFSGAKR